MIPILDNSERARRTILFFWVLLGTYILVTLVSLLVLVTGTQTADESNQAGLVTMAFGLSFVLMLGVHLAVVVVYIQWFRRAYHNLQKAGHRTEMTEGWAAGSWFVPFANMVLPYRIMKEIWYKTQVESTQTPEGHTIVRTWWLMFLGGNIASRVLDKLADEDNLSEVAFYAIVSSGIHIIGILLAVRVVRKVAGFEEGFMQRLRIETVGQQPEMVDEADDREEQY